MDEEVNQAKKDTVLLTFTLSQKEDSGTFLVHLSKNGNSDLFVFILLLFKGVVD